MTNRKEKLRKSLLAVRAQCTANALGGVELLNSAVLNWLIEHPERCIGFYQAFRGEPDITKALLCYSTKVPEVTLAVPRVDSVKDGCMHYSVWSPDMPMISGAYGIKEPREDCIIEPDVIFSPCVGINRFGYRLGNGGGFFDRYLARRAAAGRLPVTVAVAYEEIVIKENFQEDCDFAFDWIVTEQGTMKTNAR